MRRHFVRLETSRGDRLSSVGARFAFFLLQNKLLIQHTKLKSEQKKNYKKISKSNNERKNDEIYENKNISLARSWSTEKKHQLNVHGVVILLGDVGLVCVDVRYLRKLYTKCVGGWTCRLNQIHSVNSFTMVSRESNEQRISFSILCITIGINFFTSKNPQKCIFASFPAFTEIAENIFFL